MLAATAAAASIQQEIDQLIVLTSVQGAHRHSIEDSLSNHIAAPTVVVIAGEVDRLTQADLHRFAFSNILLSPQRPLVGKDAKDSIITIRDVRERAHDEGTGLGVDSNESRYQVGPDRDRLGGDRRRTRLRAKSDAEPGQLRFVNLDAAGGRRRSRSCVAEFRGAGRVSSCDESRCDDNGRKTDERSSRSPTGNESGTHLSTSKSDD